MAIDFNALAQAYDTTWGRSSTQKTETFSIKFQPYGESGLVVSYASIVSFASAAEMRNVKERESKIGKDLMKQAISKVKSKYKELTGNTLKVSEQSVEESFDVIQMAIYSPKRTAYFRCKLVLMLK